MMSDKLYAVSSEGICRRVKDLLDIYVMSYVSEFATTEIYDIWDHTGRIPGDFSQFYSQAEEIENAYVKMKGIINKPSFSVLYDRLCVFLKPFSTPRERIVAKWDGTKWVDDQFSKSS